MNALELFEYKLWRISQPAKRCVGQYTEDDPVKDVWYHLIWKEARERFRFFRGFIRAVRKGYWKAASNYLYWFFKGYA